MTLRNHQPKEKIGSFLADTTYQYYSDGQLSGTGSFSNTKDFAIATGRKMDALILNGSADDKIFFEIKGNLLTMFHGIIAADGTVATYEKIKSTP